MRNSIKRLTALLLALTLCLALTACARGTITTEPEPTGLSYPKPDPAPERAEHDPLYILSEPNPGDPIATIKTSMGDIVVRLFPEIAPIAVENFCVLSETGTYDGMTFHRVMDGFMIQSGCYEWHGGSSIYDGEAFEDEFSDELWNLRGALSMANGGENTNQSQFFIVQATAEDVVPEAFEDMDADGKYPDAVRAKYKEIGGTPWLDGKHTVFGYVLSGMEVVDAIAAVEVNRDTYQPLEDVVVETIEISEWK